MAQDQENSYKLWQALSNDYDMGSYEQFKKDVQDATKRQKLYNAIKDEYDLPDFDGFSKQLGIVSTAAEQQPTGQAGGGESTAQVADQTTSAGEMVAQGTAVDQLSDQMAQKTGRMPEDVQTKVQVKPGTTQQKAAPVYKYTYFDESAIDPNEGELRMSMKPANWAYSERVNKSRGSHTKDNSPILRMSLDGGKLDVDVEREALAELKGMSDDEIYKYTNDLYNLTWGELTNEQRRDAASRLAAAGYELHVRDLGLGHAGDVDRNTDEVQTNLQDPKYRKLYDQGQWADPVDALSRQYDRLFAEQATGGTMGQQQATKMANRVLRAADKDQMFTWALQEAERTGGDPYKIYENIYDRFHAAVKDKLGAYNTRGQAAGLLGDIDAMIAEKWRAAEEADRSRGFNFGQVFADAENGGTRIADRLMDDPDMWALQYAKRTIEGVNNLIAEADHNAASGNFGAWLESSFAGGVARGFGQSVFDVRTWDMGFGDVRDATALMTALDKSDKGQPLTKAEQAMLDAKAVELAANAYFKSQVGYGYEAGKVTGESLPFMLEMMINPASKTGGLAVNKLVRYALKRFPQRGAAAVERQAVRAAERQAVRSAERSVARSLKGKVLESAGLVIETAGKKTAAGKAVRAAVKTAGNIAGSAVMAGTTGLPGVVADTQKRMIGQLDYDTDESGAAHVTGHGFGVPMIEAFKQALVARGIENVTEMSEFDVLSNWLGGLTRKALDKLHMSDVYKFFDDIRMSDVAKVVQDFEKNTHWQGTFGEYLEEVEGGILNAWLVGDQTLDQDPETGVFNVDNNVKTFLGVSLLGGAFSAVQTVGYRTPKARMRKDIEDADKQASELWGGTWQQFKNSVDGADDEEMEALLANIVVNGNYSVDQRRAAAQYIKSVVAYRGAMKGEEIRAVDGESNPEDEQSYEQGYQVQGREREQVQDDLQRAEQRLDELDFDLSSFEGWTSDAFERRIASGEHEYTDEDIEAIREYFRAKAASDGMHQRVEDDIETQVQQASDLVDKQTNQGTGMVHRATLNDGQEVYVTGGQLVMTGDGTMIDTEASDQSLFVYNPATGQPEQYNPSDFQSVDDPVNPEQLKSEAARDIRQAFAQQAEADMNGYVQQGESYDMVDEQGNALHGTVLELRPDNTAVVQVDGEQIPLAVQTQQLQTWVDNAKQARMSVEPAALPTRSAGARDNTANTGRVDNATNETIEAPAVEPMVMDEQTGEPAWLQSTPERGYQYLTGESGLSGEDITSLIDDRIAQADAAIAKASKGGTIDQRLHARQAKDYWEGVKALHDAAKNAAQQRPTVQAGTNGRGTTASQGTGTSAQQSPTGQPTTTGQTAPAGTVRVEANQAETMPVGYTAVNIDGTRADDRGQLGIRPEDEAYFLKTMNPRMMGLLNKVAKSLGWKIRLYNGVNSQERGLYNDGVVWVNRRAMTSKLAQWILGHEMTHGMGSRTRRGETFKDYKAMATAYHRRQVGDEQYEREVAALIKAYQDHLRSLGMDTSVVTREYVEEEIACDVTGDLLMNNPEMIGKLFSGVESPSKLKRIIDMIVDALDWIKKKLTFRSEEKQAFDDLIQRLNNLYRDAKAQTDIAKATAREEGSQVESGEGEREGKSFSITGNAEGSGFTASETVLEIWRVPQEDGTYKEEEHWVKKPLLDSEGNVVFRMGDKEFSGKNPITVDDLKSNPDKDIPDRIPEDGYYLKSTNANADAAQADRVGWYVAGAFKPERIIGDREAREIIDQWNAEHPDDEPVEYDFPRESGKVFNAETMQLEDDDNGPDGPNGGKRFSIDDAAYAEAVEAGDRKKVVRMVKDAAKASMPNTKAVDRWGKPRLLYHGTPQENQFYEFNGTIYMSSNRSVANEYTHYRRTFGANPRQTGRIMPVFVNMENPLEIDANRHLWRNIDVEWSDTPVTTRDIEQYAKQNGYDGVIIRRVRDNMYDNDTTAADVYIAFSPEQVKSAGPTYEQKKRSHFPWDDYMELDGEVGATYDDEGNLIPLSQRFDMGKRDIRYSLDAAVAEAEQMTETNPTDGQKESGNYRKGHVKVDGFDISIEQPKGSVRSGVDADGKEWSQEMHNTYGYIRGTEGVDGDHIDVFLSDHLDGWNGNVYVVDQVNKDRSFDEHKVMYGFNSEQEARDAYLSNYEEGWTGLGNITGVSREEFKKWVDSSHRKNKPFAEYKNVKPLQSTGTEDRARFSISERTDEAGNEVYTETREDGTKDREVVTMPDGSRDVTWFDEAGRKKEVLSYYPNGEVRQVSNYDSEGDLTRLIQYDENRRAIRHWEPRIGTDWERDENGVARGMSNGVYITPYGSRFSLAPTFYSNAARAVEGVKQEKAKAEQWKAMLTKAGGIKAGEDKWMGLSTWLDEHKGETLTKDEVAQFVRDNAVQMEETHYGEIDDDIIEEKLTPFEDEFNRLMDEAQDATDSIFTSEWGEWAYNQMRKHYGDDFEMAFALTETINGYPAIVPNRNFDGALDDAAKYFLGLGSYGDMEDINATRLDFTTPGLKNKREIAFVVPDVEPYQEYDEIHFGPENQGRAIMWVRFGETTDTDGNRVLVIDEIQSNRHQDAREKGYRSNEDYKNVQSFRAKLSKEHPEGWSVDNESARKSGLYILSKEEHEELMRLNSKAYGGENRDGIPAAPFEKNWHEVAMKRMLRLAAEEGFDKVAWTTGMQQAERYDIGNAVERIEKLDDRAFLVYPEDGSPYQELEFDEDGVYRDDDDALLNNKTMADIFGKETAEKLKNLSDGDQLTGEGLRIGGEGMKAFYDKMLPQFMNKYGKRWGVKVGEVTLNTPGKEVMHSVDVNEDMKRSVMQGQPLFSLSAEQQEKQIHSENFKRWFGDWENDPENASKVVDENGKPLVVYHQTNAKRWINRETGEDWEKLDWRKKMEWENKSQEEWEDAWEEQDFYTFDDRYARQSIEMPAIFFSPENDPHHEYGNRTIAVYLNMRNPAINPDIPNRGVTDTAGRDAMEALKAQGYDGFIRTDEDGNILEYGVFDSNQVKSATENNGEFDPGNPDIRFSVSEESQKIFDTAKRKFGETKDIREAGYVLPDGTMLDFSGRHELDPGTDSSFLAGRRTTDHRAINQISFIYDENGDEVDTGVSSDMPDFIRRGAIRIDNNAGSINLSAAPTMAQRRVLRELIRRNGGDVQVDFGDGWNSDHYVEYEEASAQRVLGDIDRYFDEGIKPESNVRFSLSGDGTVEEYNKAVNMTGRTFNVGGREVKPGITRYNFQEAFQDAILSVKKLQQVVERHFGIKLPTRENAWMYENRLSSINMHERKSFIEKVYEPMMKIADAIMKRGVKEKELNAYLICKHGLERNQVFAMRDANEEANEIVRNGGTPDMQQLIDKYRQRDYSGLTGVTGIQGDITDIEAEAQRIVDEFEQRHGQLCDELWDAIRKATQWSLRKSYQSGMMSAATFDHVRNMFQYYVPLRGWSETTAEDVYSYMMGEHGAFNGVLKKAEGRTSVADDPLATIGNMAESALIQGNRNLLKQHLLRMAQNHPTDVCQVRDVWLVEGPGGVWEPHWPNIPEDATPDEIDQILQDHEADMQQLEASGQAKRVRNNLDIPYRIDPRHVPEHAVVAKVAGVDHVVYINGNPRAAQAINGQTGAGRGTKSGFSRLIDFIFGDVKRFYSSVLTSLNINFSGANFVRDLPHAYAMTFMKQGPLKAAEYIAKSFQVIPWVFKNQLGKTGTSQMDRYFQEFLSSGAVTGYAHINDVDAWKANNKRRFARLSALGKAKVAVPRALGEVINAIGWFSETLELIPRFTAFLVERQAGKDIATATKAAKDITTNFNKKGSEVTPGVWGAVANTLRYMKMFFNPIVQGMYQFVDVASMGKENKWVGPRMVLATMHLPVLGAIVPYLNQFLLEALGGDDDDDYWLLNEYTRRNNVCIFTGNGYLKIPIAPVFRELYGMGEVVATRHAGKADNEKTTIDLIDQLRTMGSVEGQSSYNEWSLARFLLPEHFAPLIDVMNNENFTGGPIYYDNNYKEYAPEYTKAKKSTWSPLVAASKWLNEMMGGDEDIAAGNSGKWMNPAVWQHLITNVGGGFAQLAGDVVAGVTDITEGKEIDPSNIPVMKRFYSGSSDERANWARFGIYKDFEKDYTMAKEKYQALDKRGLSLTERADEMVKFAESHPKAAAIYAVWEGGIKGADIPARLEKLGKDDPAYWDLVKEAVAKAEKAMNSGYVRAWEQKRKDRPDSMSDKELNDRFDKSDNDSIRHIMADEISKRAGSQDYYGRDAQAAWSDKSVAAWEAYQDQRTSDDIKADAELSNLLKVDEDEKDKARIKMLGYIKDELNKIRRGKDATSRSAGVTGLGEGDDQRVMNELRAARKQLIEDLKNGSAEQAYRNLERRTMRLGLRKKAKEL